MVKGYKQSETKAPLCKCGCGQLTKWNKNLKRFNIYLNGHQSIGKNNPMYGTFHSLESGKKISKSNKGRKAWNKGLTKETDERVKKISKSSIGKHLSEKHRKSIGDGNRGKKRSLETRAKMSERNKGRHHSLETLKKMTGKNSVHYGKHPSKKTRKKMSEAKKGNTYRLGSYSSEETRKKISKSISGENHYNYGKHYSKEYKKKLSKSHIGLHTGEKNPMYGKLGKNNPNYGKHHTIKSKKKIGKANKGKKRSLETKEKISNSLKGLSVGEKNGMYGKGYKLKGEKNGRWLGGISFEPYTFDFNKKFKEIIKERDFHCCQMCNLGEEDLLLLKRYLVIHHIDYNKLLSIPENCITLCNKCNSIANTNRKAWTVFFQKLLKERYNYQYTQDQKIILDFVGELK